MLCGFPYKEFQMCKETKNSKEEITDSNCIWVAESGVKSLEKEGYSHLHNVRTAVAPPDWIKGKGENGILLLDDSQRAGLNILQACMDIKGMKLWCPNSVNCWNISKVR